MPFSLRLLILGEAAWPTGSPPSRFHHLAMFLRSSFWHKNTSSMALTDYLNMHLSDSWPVKFAKIQPLPCSQYKTAVFHYQRLACANQRAFDMSIGIALRVPVAATMLRDKLFEGQENVIDHSGISVFIDSDGRSGVRAEYKNLAILYSTFV
jgi:hypothetical protein